MAAAGPAAASERAPPVFSHVFRARVPAIRGVLVAVEACLAPADPDLAGRAGLILAELLNNIQRHGGIDRPARVALRLTWHRGGLEVVVIDDGSQIPPARLAGPPMPPPTRMPESGFGWPLIHLLARDLHYQRERDCNIVSFCLPR